jgi:hypothetical protein
MTFCVTTYLQVGVLMIESSDMMISFAHGSFDFQLEGRILNIDGLGPWNLTGLNDSTPKAHPLLDDLYNGEPWAVLVSVKGDAFYTPDAAESLTAMVAQDRELGRVATALVVETSVGNVARWQLAGIYHHDDMPCRFFECTEDAKLWINELIGQAKSPARPANSQGAVARAR